MLVAVILFGIVIIAMGVLVTFSQKKEEIASNPYFLSNIVKIVGACIGFIIVIAITINKGCSN